MAVTTPSYSFYLNIIILTANPAVGGGGPNTPSPAPTKSANSPTDVMVPVGKDDGSEGDSSSSLAVVPTTPKNSSAAAINALFSGHKIVGSKSNNAFQKMSERANAYISNKTMISRAAVALPETIQKIMTEFQNAINVQRRFTQGPVFVLEVSVLPTNAVSLLECVQGKESAEHYTRVVEGLEALNCKETLKKLEEDIMKSITLSLQTKLIEIIPNIINEEVKGSPLDMDCIALEDKEEARWLYTFLAFNEEMMKEAKI
mmetsp:Transcript_9071/g.11708  ORF Transcript_9071/g.11708 Transcript_9071/m.11708 type:complete len:259 (+) Transcript_9071:98-874(+)